MRIAGITISDDKKLMFGLSSIYGIGHSVTAQLLKELGIDPSLRPTDLTTEQENAIRSKIEGMKIEGDLKREVAANVKRLKDIQAYRGTRHSKRLPVHGQRTKTNARTLKGIKKTMGSGRRKLEKT